MPKEVPHPQFSDNWMVRNETFTLTASISRSKEKFLVDDLKCRWKQAVSLLFLNVSPEEQQTAKKLKTEEHYHETEKRWFEQIILLHSNPKRKYHTLCHLEEMFGYLDLAVPFLSKDKSSECKIAVVTMAIFFHDIIYEPKCSMNEEKSAEMFTKFSHEMLNSFCTKAHIQRVLNYILATKTHVLDERHKEDEYLCIFLDADMAVLGKHSPAYSVYAGLVREEYYFVERELYCSKRAEILTNFLEKTKYIFSWDKMRIGLEMRARENLQNEINQLRVGNIPGH